MKKIISFLFLSTFLLEARSQNNINYVTSRPGIDSLSFSGNDNIDTPETTKKAKPSFTFFIPNAFSPDDNGLNDIFKPITMGIDENDYQFWIFDKQGSLIFYSMGDPSIGWNGKTNGCMDVMQNDIYVW